MKKLSKVLLFLVLTIIMMMPNALGYSNDYFKFDLPNEYGNLEYQNMFVFANTNNSDRGMIIYLVEDRGLKKSVWDIDKSDLDEFVNLIATGSNVVTTERRAKLGKEKAVRVVMEDDGKYLELYILASNKYIYMVAFAGKSELDLNNSEYTMIKNSFKLKDRTTNPIAIYVLIALIAVGIKVFVTYRKNKRMYNEPVIDAESNLFNNEEKLDEPDK